MSYLGATRYMTVGLMSWAVNMDRELLDNVQEDPEMPTKAPTESGNTLSEKEVKQAVGAAETVTTPIMESQVRPCPGSALKTRLRLDIKEKIPSQIDKDADIHIRQPNKVRVVGCLVCNKPISPLLVGTRNQVSAVGNSGNQQGTTLGRKRKISNDEAGDDDPT